MWMHKRRTHANGKILTLCDATTNEIIGEIVFDDVHRLRHEVWILESLPRLTVLGLAFDVVLTKQV